MAVRRCGVVAVTAGTFDDGRTDVPGRVAGPVERVVLETRDRIGGRLHTVDLAGSPVDLGGSWIHMPTGNPMSAFARQVGVPRRSADPEPEMAAFDCAEGRRLSAAETGELLGLYDEVGCRRIGWRLSGGSVRPVREGGAAVRRAVLAGRGLPAHDGLSSHAIPASGWSG